MPVTLILVASVLLQLCAAFLLPRLIPITKHRKAWASAAIGLGLLALWRGGAICRLAVGGWLYPLNPADEVIDLIGSVFVLIGVAALGPLSRSLKSAETGLRESEERFRNLYEAAPCGFLTIDADGVIRRCNDRAERILGYAHQALVGIPFAELLVESGTPGGGRATLNEDLLGRAPLTDVDVLMRTADGRSIIIDLSVELAVDAGNAAPEFRAIIVDITGRRQAESALRESEARFRQLAENTNQVFWLTDWDTKRLLYVNAAYERLYGRSRQSAYDARRSWLDVIHPEDRPRIEELFARNASLGCYTEAEYRIVLADGIVRWVRDRSCPIRDDNGRVYRFASVAEDITDRKQAEALLNSREKEYRLLFEASPQPMMVLDLDSLDFLAVNEAAVRSYGYSKEEFTALKVTDIRPSEDIPFLMEQAASTQDGFNHVGVTRHTKKDGTVIQVETTTYGLNWQGKRAALVLSNDVTERKRAQDALRDALARFEAVIEQTPLVAVQSLDRHGVIDRWNPVCERLYGYSRSQAVGRPLQDLILSSQETLEFEQRVRVVWDEARPSPPRERSVHTLDGEVRTVYSAMFPIQQEGKVVEVIRMDVDITDRKRAEENLLRAKRLEAAGQLAGQIAHDFNNLLGPLVAYPELISEQLDCDGEVREMLGDMHDAARQIAEINQELLTLGRRGHYVLEPVDLHHLIEHSLRALPIPTNVEIRKEFSDLLPLVRGGSSQILRLLTNLLTNAFDAMPNGGTLTVRTRDETLPMPFERRADVKPGAYVRVDICDTGRGIPPDVACHVFEPFFTTKKTDKRHGSGLGLSVVHSVMEDHGGHVDFVSGNGEGTIFSLFFPVSLIASLGPGCSSGFPKGNGESVLVADDDLLQLRIAERMLKQLGYEVTTVASGEEAVAFLADHSADAVLLDMVMGGIDGTETLRRIRKTKPDQIALILSGFACSDRVDEALRLGAKGFVPKPVELANLASVLHEALNDRREIPVAPVA